MRCCSIVRAAVAASMCLVSCASAQIVVEDFAYPAGDSLTNHGWAVHSGTRSPVTVVAEGLVYEGYAGSNIGGAALLAASGEDHHREFPAMDSCTLYFSFLVRVDSLVEGFFIHLAKSNTAFAARIFARGSAGGLQFGIANNASPVYGTARFMPGTTYLCLVKYVVSGAGACTLWVREAGVPRGEADAGKPTAIASGSGQAQIGRICLRQFSGDQRTIVDGIRLGTSWNDLVAAIERPESGDRDFRILSMHPNPARDRTVLTLRASAGSNVRVTVWNSRGIAVATRVAPRTSGDVAIPLDLSGIAAGWYVVEIRDGHESRAAVLLRY